MTQDTAKGDIQGTYVIYIKPRVYSFIQNISSSIRVVYSGGAVYQLYSSDTHMSCRIFLQAVSIVINVVAVVVNSDGFVHRDQGSPSKPCPKQRQRCMRRVSVGGHGQCKIRVVGGLRMCKKF